MEYINFFLHRQVCTILQTSTQRKLTTHEDDILEAFHTYLKGLTKLNCSFDHLNYPTRMALMESLSTVDTLKTLHLGCHNNCGLDYLRKITNFLELKHLTLYDTNLRFCTATNITKLCEIIAKLPKLETLTFLIAPHTPQKQDLFLQDIIKFYQNTHTEILNTISKLLHEQELATLSPNVIDIICDFYNPITEEDIFINHPTQDFQLTLPGDISQIYS